MNQLFELLHREDVVEIQQRLNHGININDMGLRFGPNIIPRIPKGHFLSTLLCGQYQATSIFLHAIPYT